MLVHPESSQYLCVLAIPSESGYDASRGPLVISSSSKTATSSGFDQPDASHSKYGW